MIQPDGMRSLRCLSEARDGDRSRLARCGAGLRLSCALKTGFYSCLSRVSCFFLTAESWCKKGRVWRIRQIGLHERIRRGKTNRRDLSSFLCRGSCVVRMVLFFFPWQTSGSSFPLSAGFYCVFTCTSFRLLCQSEQETAPLVPRGCEHISTVPLQPLWVSQVPALTSSGCAVLAGVQARISGRSAEVCCSDYASGSVDLRAAGAHSDGDVRSGVS